MGASENLGKSQSVGVSVEFDANSLVNPIRGEPPYGPRCLGPSLGNFRENVRFLWNISKNDTIFVSYRPIFRKKIPNRKIPIQGVIY